MRSPGEVVGKLLQAVTNRGVAVPDLRMVGWWGGPAGWLGGSAGWLGGSAGWLGGSAGWSLWKCYLGHRDSDNRISAPCVSLMTIGSAARSGVRSTISQAHKGKLCLFVVPSASPRWPPS